MSIRRRGADKVHSFKKIERVLAGFEDGHADEGPVRLARGPEDRTREEWDCPQMIGGQAK